MAKSTVVEFVKMLKKIKDGGKSINPQTVTLTQTLSPMSTLLCDLANPSHSHSFTSNTAATSLHSSNPAFNVSLLKLCTVTF